MASQVELLTGLVNVAIPEVYQKGMSYYEVLTAVVNKVNELIKQSNEYFSEDVQTVMTKILIGWKDDGTLSALIADAVLDIGDRQYTEQNYVTNGESITASLDAIDTTVMSHLSDIALNINSYPRLQEEADDAPRFVRALNYLQNKGGGKLKLGVEEYVFSVGFTIPDNVEVEGMSSDSPWVSENVTLLTFTGVGDFITIKSYYDKQSSISNLNIRCTKGKESNTTAIKILRGTSSWGGSASLYKISITGFGIGVQHIRTYQSVVRNAVIHKCGTGISYSAKIEGANPSFGNVNTVEKTTVLDCFVGIELLSDTLNTFKNIDIEKNYIGILTYQLGEGYLPPQQHSFEDCWFEANGWKSDEERANNTNPRYFFCNSKIDEDFLATGSDTVSIYNFTFENCRSDLNVSPLIPTFNENPDLFGFSLSAKRKRYPTDESMKVFYNRPQYDVETVNVGINAWKRIYSMSNKGLQVKLGFNLFEESFDYTAPGTTTQVIPINYSRIINPVPPNLYVANQFSSLALVSITVKHTSGYMNNKVFLISDYAMYDRLTPTPLNEPADSGNMLRGNGIEITNITGTGTNDKEFDIQVTGSVIGKIHVKITYLPNGLLMT